MYEIRYTKGGEKDRVKLMRSPYADIAETILTQLRADPYSNSGGGLYARQPQGGPDGGDIRAREAGFNAIGAPQIEKGL